MRTGTQKNGAANGPAPAEPVHTTPTRRLSITLPETLVTAIDRQAYHHHLTRSAVIADYLTRALEP